MKHLAAAMLLVLAACQSSEEATMISEDMLAGEWKLTQLNGADFDAPATIDFSEPGRVAGQAPCNRWTAGRTGTLPELGIEQAVVTRRACPDLEQEGRFLAALSEVRAAAIEDGRLVLTGKDTRLEFAPAAE